MARPARPERSTSARPSRQLSRFYRSINSDMVFGTHRSYSESEKASQHREMPSNAVAALLLSGRNRQRRFPGTTLVMHGAPALVLAQHRSEERRVGKERRSRRPRYH